MDNIFWAGKVHRFCSQIRRINYQRFTNASRDIAKYQDDPQVMKVDH